MLKEEKLYEYFRTMYKIRRFEENLLDLFGENKLHGTTHTSIGEEANAVTIMNHVTDKDYVFSNHRCHGHFIAYSNDPKILLAEIMGKESGICKGRGGSQHIGYKNFYTNGVQGGIVPDATGIALAEKFKGTDGVAVTFIGDGTLGQGIVYESFNMASLYDAPILYVIEDNTYAMTTKNTEGVAGSMIDRPKSFGIESAEITTTDVEELDEAFEKAFDYVRKNRKPFCQVVHFYRLGPHSKSDDDRDPAEIAEAYKKDPIAVLEAKLDATRVAAIKAEVEKEILDATEYASNEEIDSDPNLFDEIISIKPSTESLLNTDKKRCLDGLNKGLDRALTDMENVVLMGEDIRDPYGGAFKVTKGLTAKHDKRLINTPISEAGFIGLSVGMAMNGLKPVSEMMFGDFITLGFDQLLNHATKFNWMYAGLVDVPMLVRIPTGGGRGYGATHSQSLEKFLVGIPNLHVIAVNRLLDSEKLVYKVIRDLKSPTVLIENKKMYGERLYVAENGKVDLFTVTESQTDYPTYRLSLAPYETADAAIVTYGAMTDIAMEVAKKMLLEEEKLVDVIVCTSLNPIDSDNIIKYIGQTKNVLVLEEGTERGGWAAEVIAELTAKASQKTYARVAALNTVMPCCSELEQRMLPSEGRVIDELWRMI